MVSSESRALKTVEPRRVLDAVMPRFDVVESAGELVHANGSRMCPGSQHGGIDVTRSVHVIRPGGYSCCSRGSVRCESWEGGEEHEKADLF